MSKKLNRNCPHNETYQTGDVTVCRTCGRQMNPTPEQVLAAEFNTTPENLRRDFANLERQIQRLAAELVAERNQEAAR